MNKLYSQDTVRRILQAPEAKLMEAICWSAKESVYKSLKIQNRVFNPKKYKVQAIQFEERLIRIEHEETSYVVHFEFDEDVLYTHRKSEEGMVHFVKLNFKPNEACGLINHVPVEGGWSLKKTELGKPFLVHNKGKAQRAISMSHDGRFGYLMVEIE